MGNKIALYYDDGERQEQYTFLEMKRLSDRFADVLKSIGVKKQERVVLFLPRSPEFYISFLGIVKAGAIAVPICSEYMGDAVSDILKDSDPAVIITTARLRTRIFAQTCPSLREIIIVGEGAGAGDLSWSQEMESSVEQTITEWMDRETPMLLLYTSGSTGKPKGVVHVHEGALHYYQTGRWVLDLQEGDIYWCTADPGWVTGISYGIWAPWLNGTTSVIYGGQFDANRWYDILEKYRVTVWYTTPTALRMLMAAGQQRVRKYNLKALRHILSVGEPLNPLVIRWGLQTFGLKVHDTWWMTETGAQLITNFPCLPVKPGSMGKLIPGIYATIINDQGEELPPLEMGLLAIKAGWPAMMRGIWKDEEKFQEYFRLSPWYLSGDLAYRDKDGYFWFQGRADDVIKTCSERVGPFEVESKLAEHPAVLEAGVIGKPDALRGEIIKAFVVLRPGYTWSPELRQDIQHFIENRLTSHLVPQEIEVCSRLPRTRSGKIMRRVLKAWELGLPTGDLSTLDE